MSGLCGSCTMCCKVMGVRGEVRGVPIQKPRAGWCEHCTPGVGCKVYEDRPPMCQEFRCIWLQAHFDGHIVADELRPDRCGVVFSPTTVENAVGAHVDRNKPDAWKRGAAWKMIKILVAGGCRVTIDCGDFAQVKTVLSMRRGEIIADQVRFSPPDENSVQWSMVE